MATCPLMVGLAGICGIGDVEPAVAWSTVAQTWRAACTQRAFRD